MGATLPGPHPPPQSRTARLSEAFGRLYAANTLGAIAGTAVAGFVLIEVLGLTGALARRGAVLGRSPARGPGCPAAGTRPRRCAPRPPLGRRGASPRSAGQSPIARGSPWPWPSSPGLTSLGYQVRGPGCWRRDRQHDLRVHGDPDDVPDRASRSGPRSSTSFGRGQDPIRLLAVSQIAWRRSRIAGLIAVDRSARGPRPGAPFVTILRPGDHVAGRRPAGDHRSSGCAFPAASALLRDETGSAGSESGSLLAANTVGRDPRQPRDPVRAHAADRVAARHRAARARQCALGHRPRAARSRVRAGGPVARSDRVAIVVAATPSSRVCSSSRTRRPRRRRTATVFASAEDEIASVQAGQVGRRPNCGWPARP